MHFSRRNDQMKMWAARCWKLNEMISENVLGQQLKTEFSLHLPS